MKRTLLIAVAGSLLLGGACTGTEQPQRERKEVTIALVGVNPAELTQASFVIASAEARADGELLPVTLDTRRANLAKPDQKLSLRVQAPVSAATVEIVLDLDDYGAFATAASSGEIDARSSRIVVRTTGPDLVEQPVTAVEVDLGRSLVAKRADKRLFLPHYAVH